VTFVLVYISGRPDGRTYVARIRPDVYQRSGLTAAVAAAPRGLNTSTRWRSGRRC